MKRWWLPEGMEELLPPSSWRAEDLRRALLDRYRERGYELILTPLVEHLDTLLTGTGSDLERQTFKLIDPASGRLLGLRADMTPQAARIAARRYANQAVVRLCYLGTVLRTQADSLGGPRSPRQVGCELFGEARIEADLEIVRLMLETLELAGVRDAHLDLGHVGIYRAIAARLKLDTEDEAALFGILQRKSRPDLRDFADAKRLQQVAARSLAELMDLNGGPVTLDRARRVLGDGADIAECLDSLERVATELNKTYPALPIHIDLAELRGYRYQTGMVFAAFAPGHGRELARGGRYDGVGREFGVARPATGFSADLNELLRLGVGQEAA
ncbi:MAG: ATP phosphoribosyltransferase regulatory subunit [Gammaproteobacteria bacterium]|nr:ATP phosphoribosyltransferase regulatory subunit [Gammaproteobacteria bacterium]